MKKSERKLCEADRILAQIFQENVKEFYGDDYRIVMQAVENHIKESETIKEDEGKVESNAQMLYRMLYKKGDSDYLIKLKREIIERSQQNEQHPAIIKLNEIIQQGSISVTHKQIIDEARNVLDLSGFPRAAFIRAMILLMEDNQKKKFSR